MLSAGLIFHREGILMVRARVISAAVVGADAQQVEVTAEVFSSEPSLVMAGVADSAVEGLRDRIRAGMVTSGVPWPAGRIVVEFSPSVLTVEASIDVAVTAAVLGAAGTVPAGALRGRLFFGQVGADGQLLAVRGVVPAVLAAAAAGIGRVVVPVGNAVQAALVPGVVVEAIADVTSLVGLLRGQYQPPVIVRPAPAGTDGMDGPDLADLAGQPLGRWAVQVAAAGGHHLMLLGRPGSGATMLAHRLPGLLPDLDEAASLEVTTVHSAANLLPPDAPLMRRPPFQAPHHSVTPAALAGGGPSSIRPGAASLAHHGVLFCDDALEFNRRSLEVLRAPLHTGVVEVARAGVVVRMPARFQLVLAARPCPCRDHPVPPQPGCGCPPEVRRRYLARLPAIVLDGIDISVALASPGTRADEGAVDSSAVVAGRVAWARAAMAARLAGTPWRVNAHVPGRAWQQLWPLPPAITAPVDRALDAGAVSQLGWTGVVRVAWTLADLACLDQPGSAQIAHALELRGVGRPA
jgi:magnesium chelatase family protein